MGRLANLGVVPSAVSLAVAERHGGGRRVLGSGGADARADEGEVCGGNAPATLAAGGYELSSALANPASELPSDGPV